MQHLFLWTVHFFIRCGGGGGEGWWDLRRAMPKNRARRGAGGRQKKILGVKRWSPKEFFQVLQ